MIVSIEQLATQFAPAAYWFLNQVFSKWPLAKSFFT